MKTPEELTALRAELESLNARLAGLTEDELNQITGGDALPGSLSSAWSAGDIVARAKNEIGKPYAWGAVGPAAYDCSGLVSYCITGTHTRIGTTTTFMGWPRVSDPQPGDICTNSYHCGIYVGANTMIHAPTFGQCVCYSGVMSDMIIVRP